MREDEQRFHVYEMTDNGFIEAYGSTLAEADANLAALKESADD